MTENPYVYIFIIKDLNGNIVEIFDLYKTYELIEKDVKAYNCKNNKYIASSWATRWNNDRRNS